MAQPVADTQSQMRAAETEVFVSGKWQPIETAPKDEWFLGVHADSKVMITSHWPHFRSGAWWCATNSNGETWAPTHWMPLPEPPHA